MGFLTPCQRYTRVISVTKHWHDYGVLRDSLRFHHSCLWWSSFIMKHQQIVVHPHSALSHHSIKYLHPHYCDQISVLLLFWVSVTACALCVKQIHPSRLIKSLPGLITQPNDQKWCHNHGARIPFLNVTCLFLGERGVTLMSPISRLTPEIERRLYGSWEESGLKSVLVLLLKKKADFYCVITSLSSLTHPKWKKKSSPLTDPSFPCV